MLLHLHLHLQSIPTSFMKQLELELESESELKMQAETETETVVLMSEYQPSRHWVVTLKQARFFTNGWSQFCLHHDFQVGDFLLFTYHSHFLFHVSAFDPLSASLRLPLKTPAHGIPSKLHTSTSTSSCVVNLTRYNVEKAIIVSFFSSSPLHFFSFLTSLEFQLQFSEQHLAHKPILF